MVACERSHEETVMWLAEKLATCKDIVALRPCSLAPPQHRLWQSPLVARLHGRTLLAKKLESPIRQNGSVPREQTNTTNAFRWDCPFPCPAPCKRSALPPLWVVCSPNQVIVRVWTTSVWDGSLDWSPFRRLWRVLRGNVGHVSLQYYNPYSNTTDVDIIYASFWPKETPSLWNAFTPLGEHVDLVRDIRWSGRPADTVVILQSLDVVSIHQEWLRLTGTSRRCKRRKASYVSVTCQRKH